VKPYQSFQKGQEIASTTNSCRFFFAADNRKSAVKKDIEKEVEAAPDTATGTNTADTITDKRGYAARWKFSVRTIDTLLAKGLPHCKVGKRRVRLVVSEADKWMAEQFRVQRRAA
jgi:hypothetical protein